MATWLLTNIVLSVSYYDSYFISAIELLSDKSCMFTYSGIMHSVLNNSAFLAVKLRNTSEAPLNAREF